MRLYKDEDHKTTPYRMYYKFLDHSMFDNILTVNDKIVFCFLLDRYRLSLECSKQQEKRGYELSYINDYNEIYCVYDELDIAKDTGLGLTTVKGAIKKFKKYQFMKIENINRTNRYYIYNIEDIKNNLIAHPEILQKIDKHSKCSKEK